MFLRLWCHKMGILDVPGLTLSAGDKRYSKQPASYIGTRVFGGRMGTVNNSTASTFQIVCELAQQFDAVRLVLANTQNQISDVTVSMKVSTPTTAADLNNSAGTWTTVTKSALSRMATAIAPA
jgi:hypothetical protein